MHFPPFVLVCILPLHTFDAPMKPPSSPLPFNPPGAKLVGFSHFTMSGLAALCTSTFAPGFSNNEQQAAARALLRHNAHIDGTHYQMRTTGGLHPSYIGFNRETNENETERTLTHSELVEAALQDVFDAVMLFPSFFS